MGGGDCPVDNDLAIVPFPASAADIPSSSRSHPPPCPPLHGIHKLKCHLKHKHKRCKKLKIKIKHKHTGHRFHHHSPPHPRCHHHHDHLHKKHHHHHGKHPFAAHPMTIHMAMAGPPPHHHL